MSAPFGSLESMILAAAEAVRPPERLTVAQAAEKYRYINNPGSYVGPYKLSTVPYLKEPMEVLTSLDYLGMIFVGPAQSAKSDMSLNWLLYSGLVDPGDFMHIDKSQSSARDFYQRRVDKLFRDQPELKAKILPGSHHQSTYSTKFTSGMLYTLSWPTVNELSGKPIGRLWIADYDRIDDDIGGEGSAYDLAVQRMKTFKRRGMCAAESSPSRTIENPRWMPETPHQAPPTTGILALYNRGDRRRWYWPCAACGTPFEPDFSLMHWPDSRDMLESAELVAMRCPYCGHDHRESGNEKDGTPGKRIMNTRGFWLKDGEKFDAETGEIIGDPLRAKIASFWLKGPAAAFADWTDMTLKFLKAKEEFDATGSEEALKTTINTDQGLPYLPIGMDAERLPEELKARAKKLGDRVVPEGVRFLLATVDVQKSRFEVQVHGFGPNLNEETGELRTDVWIIDRFKIRKSERLDEDGDPLPLDPGGYVEDWNLLISKVLMKTYPLGDGSGRTMQIKHLASDSGGREGVTANAYDWWRSLRNDPEGKNLHRRVTLLKGEPSKSAPMVKIDYPDAERKDRRAQARGEVPVMFINSNSAKDMVNNMLGRETPGGGMVFFPDWLEDWWYVELTAESRTAKGWENKGKHRNEAWDLLVYAVSLAHSTKVRLPFLDWEKPPSWAAEWDENDLVSADANPRFNNTKKGGTSLQKLAEALG